jgi:hypothetical protein
VSVLGGVGDVVESAFKTVVAVEPVQTAIAMPRPLMANTVIRPNFVISGPNRCAGVQGM